MSTAAAAARPGARRRPAGRLRQRLRAWWHQRLPASDTLVLTQHNVYILPTRPGLLFAATLVVLLVASINYQLNLGYLLTFLLAGAGVAGMYVTHSTLRGLTLHLKPPAAVFADQAALLEVALTNEARRERYGIGLRVLPEPGEAPPPGWAWTDVPAQAQAVAHVSFQPQRRGWHAVPMLTAETRFPLGIFRVWTLWRPASRLLVYPAPESFPPPLPAPLPHPGQGQPLRQGEGGETDGVRAYRRGDPLKHVVWKKVAKTGELVSRETGGAALRELWLDYLHTGAQGAEQRLSRLAAWVLAAEQAGLRYGLRLPGVPELLPDHGEAHKRRCLEQLALYR
ncbi:DUF58 domain-containing protein [Caldimonas thermodepolymerans]|uniref:Uncharacterized protein (DUF58 family) n=1 Tax=Caldimonas thermodepolymerans TaxID=215580 RepID=A0AA46HUL1_9BURK|nr:DUF58 domain-containing protein [Caldimonas thermodepolymerans]TCP03644.1 uncharacterized protein (DUF58 family) [Caldimonas thermodepolymerans]UZG43161.1 DUF58 domain-containing protein [Caldimonas thermodepolymerans]UZG46827.1 DUF58 domain-containing protein [Caldimonas thermodepolymerans]